jgi:hypothetical protein
MPHAIIPSTPRLAGGVLGLAGFALSIASGLLREADAGESLKAALVAMAVCYGVGLAVGKVGEHVVREHVASHKTRNPRPEKPQRLRALEEKLGRSDTEDAPPKPTTPARRQRPGPGSGGQPVETSPQSGGNTNSRAAA